MKKLSSILAIVIVICVVFSMSAFAADVTWKDYQDYLIEAAGGNAPDLDEFKGQVAAIGSWDEMPLDQSPWDQFFTTLGLSTWDEFVAAWRRRQAEPGKRYRFRRGFRRSLRGSLSHVRGVQGVSARDASAG